MVFDWWHDGNTDVGGTSALEIIARVREEQVNANPHAAPDQPLTVDQAHKVTQVHRDCDLRNCAKKAAAWQVMVDAGRVVPDTGRVRQG